MENTSKLLICDENSEERKKIADFLLKNGFRFVDEAQNGDAALDKISANSYDLVIADLWLSRIDGISLIKAIHAKHSVKVFYGALCNKRKAFFVYMVIIVSEKAVATISVFHARWLDKPIFLVLSGIGEIGSRPHHI